MEAEGREGATLMSRTSRVVGVELRKTRPPPDQETSKRPSIRSNTCNVWKYPFSSFTSMVVLLLGIPTQYKLKKTTTNHQSSQVLTRSGGMTKGGGTRFVLAILGSDADGRARIFCAMALSFGAYLAIVSPLLPSTGVSHLPSNMSR